MSLNITVV